MSSDHITTVSDYLTNTQSVLFAGRKLSDALNGDPAVAEFAVRRLERAAEQQTSGAAGYHAFMFAQADVSPRGAPQVQERVTEDMLASVLTDLDVANVLIAAGAARGEAGERADPALLDQALQRLDNSTRAMERAAASPLGAAASPGRFGFTDDKPPDEVKSADLAAAVKTLRKRSDETLQSLLTDAQAAVSGAIKALANLDEEKVIAALRTLGVQVQDLPKVGRLLQQGVEKLKAAIDSLIRLLGSDALKQIKDKAEKVWKDIKEGKHIESALRWAFGVEGTQKRIAQVLGIETLQVAAIDKASNELPRLAIRFRETMKMLESVIAAVGLGGTLLSMVFSAAAPQIALAGATILAVILGGIVLFGMDYTDSRGVLRRVRGVGEIVKGVQTA